MALVGIDIGGTGAKVAAYNEEGVLLALRYREYGPVENNEGKFELDPSLILANVREMLTEVAAVCGGMIEAIGCSSMGECFVLLDESDRILANCITYHDRRGQEIFADFQKNFSPDSYKEHLKHLRPGSVQSLFRFAVIRKEQPDVIERTRRICLLADFILYMLGAEHCCDTSLAVTTGCFDTSRNDWYDPFLKWAGLPAEYLPRPVHPGTSIGRMSDAVAKELGIRNRPHLVPGGNDQLACSIGTDICHPGQVYNAIGTADAMRTFTNDISVADAAFEKGLGCEKHFYPELYWVNPGASYSGASLLKWCRDHFLEAEKLKYEQEGKDFYNEFERRLPKTPTGLLVIPQFSGLLSESLPHGGILNLSFDTSNEAIYRGFMEGESLAARVRLDKIKGAGLPVKEVSVIGGASRSSVFMQLRSEIFNTPIITIDLEEAGTFGDAVLGGVAAGVWATPEEIVKRSVRVRQIFTPNADHVMFYQELYRHYLVAEEAAREYAKVRDC